MAEDLPDLEDSFNDKREKEQKKHQKKKEKNEDTHQKKIAAIMRRFEMSRLRAIIDRDARAIKKLARSLGVDAGDLVNEDIADKGLRAVLPIPVGTIVKLRTGETGDEADPVT